MIRSLKIFCDLVETQSFTETARRNYITQSAVSHHLKALEAKFGHRLLERRPRPARLTQPGRTVYESSKDLVAGYQRLEASLNESPNELAGPLEIATTLAVGLHTLPRFMTAFLTRYPKVQPRLTFPKEPVVYETILTHRAEIGFLHYPTPHPQVERISFLDDRLVLIIPGDHEWANRKHLPLRQLNGQAFVAFEPGLPTRNAIEGILRKADVRVPIPYSFDNVEIVKRAVAVKLGVSLVPYSTVVTEVQAGSLKAIEITEGPLACPIGIVVHARAALTRPAQRFLDILRPSRPPSQA